MNFPAPEDLRSSCRRIFLRNLRLPCRIGAYESERGRAQEVCFNADVWVSLEASTSRSDSIGDVLNYDLIALAIREEALSGHIDLQETLVDRIAGRIAALPGVKLARISSEKTEAYPDADAVGVEVWRAPNSL